MAGKPDESIIIFEGERFYEQGYQISKVELCLYTERVDDKLGVYSLITSIVHTDLGSIEMIYDEGFRGEDSLRRTAKFLSENLGVSSLVLRSIIALNMELADSK